MKKIDRETVSRIIDAADIVEVVSDFVTLKRRGANYIGLCPFHSERTPSFSVSKAKGICKCFSCGKGGSPVNFLMELEQMSYQEALRWLAKKYNIPIKEHEETEEERQQASEREALFAINSFAMSHFENNLFNTSDGQEIGLAYFKERALTLETIKKFQLGYALEQPQSLFNDAIKNGFTEENLIKTGLCTRNERGIFDRFRGRVIYPVHSISGKVVAFGGRTLKTDKTVAKYVNSPESEIYSKSRELYGLFQARREIVKEDKCILVEGYMDVLSMSQSGVENVVASSGTSLTSQQVNLIHRFTDNVTVIYDADAAGIKASLRGIDMLLSEGINVKVVLFPEGEDPDSYARTHTREELKAYLDENETDFIGFKTNVLLSDTGNDPVKRSHAIADILRSIAAIPDPITRQVYIEQSARTFGIESKLLALEVAKGVAKIAENAFVEQQKKQASSTLDTDKPQDTVVETINNAAEGTTKPDKFIKTNRNPLVKFEKAILRYLLRYGQLILSEAVNEDGSLSHITVLDYVVYEFEKDNMKISDPVFALLFERLVELSEGWDSFSEEFSRDVNNLRTKMLEEGREQIRNSTHSLSEIEKAEILLKAETDAKISELEKEARMGYFRKKLLSDPDDNIRNVATELIAEKHRLSRVHSKFAHVATEDEKLAELVPRAVFELKDAILRLQIEQINKQISSGEGDTQSLFRELMEKMKIRSEFARYLGDRIITPRIS